MEEERMEDKGERENPAPRFSSRRDPRDDYDRRPEAPRRRRSSGEGSPPPEGRREGGNSAPRFAPRSEGSAPEGRREGGDSAPRFAPRSEGSAPEGRREGGNSAPRFAPRSEGSAPEGRREGGNSAPRFAPRSEGSAPEGRREGGNSAPRFAPRSEGSAPEGRREGGNSAPRFAPRSEGSAPEGRREGGNSAPRFAPRNASVSEDVEEFGGAFRQPVNQYDQQILEKADQVRRGRNMMNVIMVIHALILLYGISFGERTPFVVVALQVGLLVFYYKGAVWARFLYGLSCIQSADTLYSLYRVSNIVFGMPWSLIVLLLLALPVISVALLLFHPSLKAFLEAQRGC